MSASNVTDWGSLNTSLDSCSVETSDVISVSGEMDLNGSWHSYENKAVALDQQKTKEEQVLMDINLNHLAYVLLFSRLQCS